VVVIASLGAVLTVMQEDRMKGRLTFCLALLLAGCGMAARDEGDAPPAADRNAGVEPPNVDPHKALKLTAEPPVQPVSLRGPIRLNVWLENACDQSLVICRRLDGSGHIPWPTYELHVFDAAGQEVRHTSYRTCKTRHPLKKHDFIRLGPGERVDVFAFLELSLSGPTYASEYPALKPEVPYTLTVTYHMADWQRGWGTEQDEITMEAAPLFREAVRCEITSPPVPVRFSDGP
jgi:hypothetical protein